MEGATVIKPIELSMSDDAKAFAEFIQMQQNELREWCRDNLGISEDKLGTPQPKIKQ